MTKKELRDQILEIFPIIDSSDRLIIERLTDDLKEIIRREVKISNEKTLDILTMYYIQTGKLLNRSLIEATKECNRK